MPDGRLRDACPANHPTPTKEYRDGQGYCLRCRVENARERRREVGLVLAEARRIADALMAND
jgi:hypothetical protein